MRAIEQIINAVRTNCPDVDVQQLKLSNPVDDDGLWFFTRLNNDVEVQIESSTGMCPFLIETNEDDTRIVARSVEDATEAIRRLLRLKC